MGGVGSFYQSIRNIHICLYIHTNIHTYKTQIHHTQTYAQLNISVYTQHIHTKSHNKDGAPTSMTRGQGINSKFSTMVRHRGRLGTVIQTVFSFGVFFFYGGCVLADQSPPSSRVASISASRSCRVNYT